MSCCTYMRGLRRVFSISILALLSSGSFVWAQMTGITVETVADHDTTGIEALAGHKTYRFYAEFINPTDKVSAVFGDASAPLTLTSSDGFFNAIFGGDFAMEVNPALFSFFFEAAYDSWFTIGYAPGDAPQSNLTAVGLTAQLAAFNNTGQIDLGDAIGGSYFTTDDPHAVAGEDLKVLLGQLTTEGTFTGVFNVQVFVEGSSANEQIFEDAVFSNDPTSVAGCTDETAVNFDATATVDDGSCTYPCTLQVEAAVTDATCPGGDDGSVVLTVTGQQLEVTYGLDGALPSQLLASFNNLSAGAHEVVAMDGLGCVDTVSFEVGSPAPFALEATSVQALCGGPGGALTVLASGGTAPYTYQFEDITNTHGAFAFVPAGTHVVNITDAFGCSEDVEVEVVGISEATAEIVANPTCVDAASGQAVLALNGNAPDTVEWLEGGGAVDAEGLVTGLTEGLHSAVVTANGCSDTVTWAMELDLDLGQISFQVTDASCAGFSDGAVQFPGADTDWDIVSGMETTAWSEAGVTGLSAGTYNFTLSRSAECAVDFDVTVGQPDPLQWSVSSTNPVCDGDATGMVQATLNGGTTPFDLLVNGTAWGQFSGTAELINLNPGTYTLAAVDANGCAAEALTVISWPEPVDAPEVMVSAPQGYADGAATALVDPSFDLAWTDVAGNLLGTEATLTGLEAGTVVLTITNAQGCSASTHAVIPFAGCTAIGASDWPAEAQGLYPVGYTSVATAMPFTEEWVLQLPSAVTPPTADYALPVTAFLPESISGLPEGVVATANFEDAVPVDGAWCLELSGQINSPGTYPITVHGTYYIELFGSTFPAPGFSYMKALVVEELEEVPAVEGCTYFWAANFNPQATVDDGSCTIAGCMEPGACNYEPLATAMTACDFSCYGCTYAEATNYDLNATRDDGSCTFPAGSGDGGCMWDGDGNNYINSNDLLLFLGQYDTPCD